MLNCYYLFPNVGVPEDKFDEVPTKELTNELSHPEKCLCCNYRRRTIVNNDLVAAEENLDDSHEPTFEYVRRQPGYELNLIPETDSVPSRSESGSEEEEEEEEDEEEF